jgi:alanine racemase
MASEDTASPSEPVTTTGGPPAGEAGGVLTIDLGAIFDNYRALAVRVLPTECAAVVKADAYGCGLAQVVPTLTRAGCKTFFVAHLAEAKQVRALAPESTIYVLNGFIAGTGPAFAETYALPIINSSQELGEWDHFVQTSGFTGGCGIHVDTGMNRLGLTIDETAAVAARMHTENHGLTLLMSHFACADRPDNPLNDQQIRQFREIRVLFRGIASSLANSAGIFLDKSAYCDLVRPGIALYGGNPVPGKPNPMRSVIDLKARVLQVRTVPKGAAVGYQSAWTARRASRIAVIAAGYGDGVARAATQTDAGTGRDVLVAGKRCRIVGRISMDLMAVDVTDIPTNEVRRGDMITLIGDGLPIDEVAAQAGTIGYEVLTNLGHRYHRIWKV